VLEHVLFVILIVCSGGLQTRLNITAYIYLEFSTELLRPWP